MTAAIDSAGTPGESPYRFDDEVVVVTGAGHGLGRSYADAFADRGAHVVVTDIDADAVDLAVKDLRSRGWSAFGVVNDVLAADDTIARVLNEFGRIDALVNNAGIVHSGSFADGGPAQIDRLLRVHALGTAAMTAAAWPALQASAGRVVNVSSGAIFGLPRSTAYASAKGAIAGLTRALANEPDSSVRCNAIMPMARTRTFEDAGGVTDSSEDLLVTEHFPPESVCPTVVFLASSTVPCTGQIFEVAGAAVSRIVFASGPIIRVDSVEDIESQWARLESDELTEARSLAGSVADKLAFLL